MTSSRVARALCVLAAGYVGVLGATRRHHQHWGATEAEIARALPGDDLIPAPQLDCTHAITIHAPAERVWPWLTQMGYAGRAGFYSYDALERRFGARDAHRLRQDVDVRAAGQTLPFAPGRPMTVVSVDPPRALVFWQVTSAGSVIDPNLPWGTDHLAWSWAFVVEDIDEGMTRLLTRMRVTYRPAVKWAAPLICCWSRRTSSWAAVSCSVFAIEPKTVERGLAHWTPELVLHDAAEFAGPIVAASVGAPNVVTSFGPLLPGPRVAGASKAVAPLWQAAGLPPRPFGGCYDHLYLDIYPPALQPELPAYIPRRHMLRPVPAGLGDTAPAEVAFPADGDNRPLVYVTMGTVFNEPTVLRRVVDAVAGLDVRVLVTVGPAGDPNSLGVQPSHVRVERDIPQLAILGECAAVVSHGGSGTVLGALAYGVPQLCLPQGADQFLNAEVISAAGAGLALLPAAADTDAVRAGVARLLTDDSFRAPAQAAAASIAAMPGPDDVAVVLEQLPRRELITTDSRLLWVSPADMDHSSRRRPSSPAPGQSKADDAAQNRMTHVDRQNFSQ